MSGAVNIFMIYQFLRRLVLPFNQWEAFKLGIIDADGEVLIPQKKFTEPAQYKAWTPFDIVMRNLKRLLAKVPGGNTVMGSYAAAFLLLREGEDKLAETDPEVLRKEIERLIQDLADTDCEALLSVDESEVPTNVASGVAGTDAVMRPARRRNKKLAISQGPQAS